MKIALLFFGKSVPDWSSFNLVLSKDQSGLMWLLRDLSLTELEIVLNLRESADLGLQTSAATSMLSI